MENGKLNDEEIARYSRDFNENKLWEKIKKMASKLGKEVILQVLILFYAWKSPNTPAKDKIIIVAALGYFICPIDVIPDVIPGIGKIDDIAVIGAAIKVIFDSITPEVKSQAEEKLKEWFD